MQEGDGQEEILLLGLFEDDLGEHEGRDILLRRSVNNLHLPSLPDQITHMVQGDVRIPLRIVEAPVRIFFGTTFPPFPLLAVTGSSL